VEFDAAVRVPRDAVEYLDDIAGSNAEPGLFAHLPHHRRVQFLARFDYSPRQAPAALQRLLTSFDEQHALSVDDDGADADDGPIRILPHPLL